MADEGLDYSILFNKDLPPPVGRFQGHPKYNFIGGHHDAELQPMDGFIESAASQRFSGRPQEHLHVQLRGPSRNSAPAPVLGG